MKHEVAFSRIYELLKHIDTSTLSKENIADLGYIKIYVKDIEDYINPPIKWEPLKKTDNLMTVEKFIEDVNSGYLTDYDGYGYYATNKEISDKAVVPSDCPDLDKSFTHVVWYNR